MSYILFLLYSPFYFIMKLVTFLLSPVLAGISVIFNFNRYPFPLNLFHTIDDDLDGGQHQLDWKTDINKFGLFWQRTCWICRNPASGFDSIVLGLKEKNTTVTVNKFIKVDGKTLVKKCTLHNKIDFFEYRRRIPLTSNHDIAIWVGWDSGAHGGYYKYKFEFHPFKRDN